jgi:hypothetical protein
MASPKNNWTTELLASDWCNEVASLLAQVGSVAVAGGADVTLSSAQYRARVILVTGALTAAQAIILPADSGRAWIVVNATSGAFVLTVKVLGSTGIVVTQGNAAEVFYDGTDVRRAGPEIAYTASSGQVTAAMLAASAVTQPKIAASTGIVYATDDPANIVSLANGETILKTLDAGTDTQLELRRLDFPAQAVANVFITMRIGFHDGATLDITNNTAGAVSKVHEDLILAIIITGNNNKSIRKITVIASNTTGSASANVNFGAYVIKAYALPKGSGAAIVLA